ncbi:hypothetical protein [Flagellimonas lutaonensis]|uniref:Uncharacterized protein n=1 Tax=Flagellimonas lutaonensis TaxID=516051 RepID=A0A0D5YSJ2_9FLAO|nr:hypothetical protein [Allomuricauda lutaonensis]AKA35272.1 hypothetical protein VC82_1659 [Allomuricauda lutaonensis]
MRINFRLLTSCILYVQLFTGCASGYDLGGPENANFVSNTSESGLKLYYKYDVLSGKYAKKELRNGIKVIAVKIINTAEKDYVFGENVVLQYDNGDNVHIMDSQAAYKSLKQGSAIYLLYLLLTPVNLYTYTTDSYGIEETTNSIPIGLVLGPSMAGGNIIASGSANKKFKMQLSEFDIMGAPIKKGETIYGLIPIKAGRFDALTLKIAN